MNFQQPFLSPLRGFLILPLTPTAGAPSASLRAGVGCILSPLRGWGEADYFSIVSLEL